MSDQGRLDDKSDESCSLVLRRCPSVGIFGWCENSGCSANYGGPCPFLQQIVTYDTSSGKVVYER